jgi:hypothetical protein
MIAASQISLFSVVKATSIELRSSSKLSDRLYRSVLFLEDAGNMTRDQKLTLTENIRVIEKRADFPAAFYRLREARPA